MKNFETTRNVLIAVDMQNDFITGSLAVHEAEQTVTPINQLAERVRTSLGRVAFTRDWHPVITPHFTEYGGLWPVHCVAETDGAAFHPDLAIKDEDIIISKGMGQTDGYSGMEGVAEDGTTIESLLLPTSRRERVRGFLGGLATDFCDKATAIDAARRFDTYDNVEIYAIPEAMRAVNLQPDDGTKAIAEMAEAGVKIITLEQAFALIDQERIES
jgi:nicotinamidase/pyrazinamidase